MTKFKFFSIRIIFIIIINITYKYRFLLLNYIGIGSYNQSHDNHKSSAANWPRLSVAKGFLVKQQKMIPLFGF